MKNPFSHYPAVFYQLSWIYLLNLFCLIVGFIDFVISIQRTSLFMTIDFDPTPYLLGLMLIISFAVGYFFDRIKDSRRSITIGINLILVGFLLSVFSMDISFLIVFSLISIIVGFLLIYIACIDHVAILFPVANDWKDNGFGYLSYLPLFFGILLGILIALIGDITMMSTTFFVIIKIFAIGLMYFFINQFEDIGYEVEEVEEGIKQELELEVEEINEEEITEGSTNRDKLMGVIIVYMIYTFIVSYIGDLSNFNNFSGANDILGLDDVVFSSPYGTLYISLTVVIFFLGIGLYAFYNASNNSRQFTKLTFINYVLVIIVILEILIPFIGSSTLDIFLSGIYQYFSFLILFPIFLSIYTHINVEKNIGMWLIAFTVIPSFIILAIEYFLPRGLTKNFPYVAVGLLIIYLIVFRENRKNWEEQLALNESNQADDDDMEMDILEHFVE